MDPDSDLLLPKGVILIGGTEDEYITGLRQLRWARGDFDPDDPPDEIAAWQARQLALPERAPEPEVTGGSNGRTR